MKESKLQCLQQKELVHYKIISLLLVGSAIHGLVLSIDDIIILGTNLSAFVLPYLFNFFAFFFSLFHIYVTINFRLKQRWTLKVFYLIFAVRFFFAFYDVLEIIPVVLILPYYVYLTVNKRLDSVFAEKNSI